MTANTSGTIIATGYNCRVGVGNSVAEAMASPIALVASFQATEDFQVQEAVILGHLGPVCIDPQGYTCSITLDGFLPKKGALQANDLDAVLGRQALMEQVPTREAFMQDGGIPMKFEYLVFYKHNENENPVIAAFKGAIFTSNGVSVEGNSYAKNNVQIRALEWVR